MEIFFVRSTPEPYFSHRMSGGFMIQRVTLNNHGSTTLSTMYMQTVWRLKTQFSNSRSISY